MDIYGQRLQNVRTAMQEWGLDTLAVVPGASMRYLTGYSEEGYERLLALVVPDDREPVLIVPSLNAAHARANPAGIGDIRDWTDEQGWPNILREVCRELDLQIGIIGVDDAMPARFLLKMQEMLPTTLFKSAAPVFAQTRTRKDAGELAAMQHAAETTDRAIVAGFAACKPGATELEVAQAIDRSFASEGAAQSFTTIVGSGPNSALPHHSPGQRRLRQGELVVLDFGARYGGYCGDITRVIALGEPGPEARKVYETVSRAYHAALAHAKPGVTAASVDAAARKVITEAGYGEFFIHRTGHGIGLEDHEEPNIVSSNPMKLEPGMCFSIEPGIYLPGKFGVRLENIVTVTEDGCRSFNQKFSSELTVL